MNSQILYKTQLSKKDHHTQNYEGSNQVTQPLSDPPGHHACQVTGRGQPKLRQQFKVQQSPA
jgi:hypothetical protein